MLDVRTRSGGLPRPPKGGWFAKLFPSMRNVKIRRNQRRGGTPCPPEGSWFAKLFPAVQILQNQNRRNVCPCRTVYGRARSPAPTSGQFNLQHGRNVCPCRAVHGRRGSLPLRAGFLFSSQPGRVSASDCVRAGTESRPTAADNLFPALPGPPSSYSPAGSSTMMVVRKFILLSGRCSLSKL